MKEGKRKHPSGVGIRKGVAGLVMIKIFMLALIFIGQACQREATDDGYRNVEREMALQEFESSYDKVKPFLSSLIKKDLESKELGGKYGNSLTSKQEKIRKVLQPVSKKGRKLLHSYGLSDEEIAAEFGTVNAPEIILAGIILLNVERGQSYDTAFHFGELFGSRAYAQVGPTNEISEVKPDWVQCMIQAVGVEAIIEFAKGNVTKSIAKKAIRKIASRTLGWVGVALALYEYSNCMGWI